MKKKLFTLSLLAVCLSLCIGGTLAFFSAIGTARNVITAGDIRIELIEEDGNGAPFKNADGVVPGAEIGKVVKVKNISEENECWVRIKVTKKITLAEGVMGTPRLEYVEIDFNDTEWIDGGDGFFYYNSKLKAGHETEAPLFTTVKFNTKMDNLYAKCKAEVLVEAQAVQCANNGETVSDAKGWPRADKDN